LADLGFGVINKTGNKLEMIDYAASKPKPDKIWKKDWWK
jgi:hypothetical protein